MGAIEREDIELVELLVELLVANGGELTTNGKIHLEASNRVLTALGKGAEHILCPVEEHKDA